MVEVVLVGSDGSVRPTPVIDRRVLRRTKARAIHLRRPRTSWKAASTVCGCEQAELVGLPR
jgi:hypothetical protein